MGKRKDTVERGLCCEESPRLITPHPTVPEVEVLPSFLPACGRAMSRGPGNRKLRETRDSAGQYQARHSRHTQKPAIGRGEIASYGYPWHRFACSQSFALPPLLAFRRNRREKGRKAKVGKSQDDDVMARGVRMHRRHAASAQATLGSTTKSVDAHDGSRLLLLLR